MEGIGGQKPDGQLQEFLAMEQAKAQFSAQVHKLTGVCWDMCLDKPRDKLDYRTEQCFTNCVERFIDTSLQITGRFQQMLSRGLQQWYLPQLIYRYVDCVWWYEGFLKLMSSRKNAVGNRLFEQITYNIFWNMFVKDLYIKENIQSGTTMLFWLHKK